jgi:hypothetical protein
MFIFSPSSIRQHKVDPTDSTIVTSSCGVTLLHPSSMLERRPASAMSAHPVSFLYSKIKSGSTGVGKGRTFVTFTALAFD